VQQLGFMAKNDLVYGIGCVRLVTYPNSKVPCEELIVPEHAVRQGLDEHDGEKAADADLDDFLLLLLAGNQDGGGWDQLEEQVEEHEEGRDNRANLPGVPDVRRLLAPLRSTRRQMQ